MQFKTWDSLHWVCITPIRISSDGNRGQRRGICSKLPAAHDKSVSCTDYRMTETEKYDATKVTERVEVVLDISAPSIFCPNAGAFYEAGSA